MNNTLILTSITNSKDQLLDPKIKFEDCDYVAFVEKEYDVNTWKQVPVMDFSTIDSYKDRRNAKQYKILSTILFQEYEYIIWVDGNKELKMDPKIIYDNFGDFDVLLFSHPDRGCLYDEMSIIKHIGLDDKNKIDEQYSYYKSSGMPENWGLFEMSSFIKKNNEITRKLDFMWWEHICKFSSRDQTSLPFILWKLEGQIKYKILPGYANTRDGVSNEYFEDRCFHLK